VLALVNVIELLTQERLNEIEAQIARQVNRP
jgi:hypothetical protein